MVVIPSPISRKEVFLWLMYLRWIFQYGKVTVSGIEKALLKSVFSGAHECGYMIKKF